MHVRHTAGKKNRIDKFKIINIFIILFTLFEPVETDLVECIIFKKSVFFFK